MSTTVVIPTKNEVIGVRKILPQIKKEWADEWIVMDGNSNDGTINLSVTGGTAPFTYLWSNGSPSQDISNLSACSY